MWSRLQSCWSRSSPFSGPIISPATARKPPAAANDRRKGNDHGNANAIGSAFLKGEEQEETILNPEERRDHPQPARSLSGADRGGRFHSARGAFSTWSRTTPCRTLGLSAEDRRRHRSGWRCFAALEALNCGKPINAVRNDEIPAIVDCFRFFAGAIRNQHGTIAVNICRASPR